MARVNDAETEVDQLRSDLKTMKHLKKAAIQERIKIEEVLESRLGGGSRSAGGDSNESSNTVLTALERAEKDVTLLQSLEDVVVQMSMERDRRTNLCKCRGMSWLSLSFVGFIVECCCPTTVPLLTFNCTVLFCASGTDMSGLVSRLGIAAGLGESKPTDRYVLCF